jgi:hypothetical protein
MPPLVDCATQRAEHCEDRGHTDREFQRQKGQTSLQQRNAADRSQRYQVHEAKIVDHPRQR